MIPRSFKPGAISKRYYLQEHPEKRALYAANQKVRFANSRRQVLEAYGGKCECCNESIPEFLGIDHINNDGAQHRRESGLHGGGRLYYWLRKNGFPKDRFRLLCHNCNLARGFYGKCPHELKTEVV